MASLGLEPTYEQPSLQELSVGLQPQTQPLAGGTGSPPPQRVVMFFHIVFKVAALAMYLFAGIFFSGSYVFVFVIVTLLSAFDFWTVKNVSGRLLVGLRWWNFIDEEGKSHWKFESYEDQRFIHPTDSNVFWLALFATPAIWALLALGAIITFRFMWLVLVLVAFTCSMINVVGYSKCKKDARKKLSALGGSVLSRGMEMSASLWGASRAASTRSSSAPSA